MPKDFGHLAYGSVTTSPAAGRDVDRVIIAQSAASQPAASAEQFYVSASRGKQSIAIYTDDTSALVEAVHASAERLSAIELVKGQDLETAQRLRQDLARRQGVETARRTTAKSVIERMPSKRTQPGGPAHDGDTAPEHAEHIDRASPPPTGTGEGSGP